MARCDWLHGVLLLSVKHPCNKTVLRGILIFILAHVATLLVYISALLKVYYIDNVWPLLSSFIVFTLFTIFATIVYPRNTRIKLCYGIIMAVLFQEVQFEMLIYTNIQNYSWYLTFTFMPVVSIIFVYLIEKMVICTTIQLVTILHHSIRLYYADSITSDIFISVFAQLSLLASTYIFLKLSYDHKEYTVKEINNLELLTNLIQSTPIGIAIINQSQIEFANDEFKNLLNLSTINASEVKATMQSYISDAEELPSNDINEKNYSIKIAGKLLHWKIKTLNSSIQTEVHYFIDSTAEEMMSQNEEHKKYIEMLVATSTHELRTPLSAIKCSMLILKGQNMNDASKENIERALCACDLQECLINDVMDFSKIQGDKLRINFEKIDLEAIIMTCMKIVEIQIKDKNLEFHLHMSSGVSEEINSDANRVRQIILNLLSNAIKFTFTGSITIKVKFSDHNVYISIIDTGIGIKKDDIKLLFRPFGILDSTVKINKSGTGLGLNLCKTLCNKLGGDISCESEYEKGCTFTFYLPTMSANPFNDTLRFMPSQSICINSTFNQLLAPLPFQSSFYFESDYILLVDDSILTITLTEKLIMKIGNPCLKAYNGVDALQKLRETKFKILLALIDINMPIMDGYTLADEIFTMFEDKRLVRFPLYALTGDGAEDVDNSCKIHHFDFILTKPLNANKLRDVIQSNSPH